MQDEAPPSGANRLPESAALTEGEDYYYDGALIVFTAYYHLKRGSCCNSGCRHCPYKQMPPGPLPNVDRG